MVDGIHNSPMMESAGVSDGVQASPSWFNHAKTLPKHRPSDVHSFSGKSTNRVITTTDIPGARSVSFYRYTNRPAKEEIAGASPCMGTTRWNRPVMNLDSRDIDGAFPHQAVRHRCVNPLEPSYKLASCTTTRVVSATAALQNKCRHGSIIHSCM